MEELQYANAYANVCDLTSLQLTELFCSASIFWYKYSYFSDGLISRLQNFIFAYTALFMSFGADADWININKEQSNIQPASQQQCELQHTAALLHIGSYEFFIPRMDGIN